MEFNKEEFKANLSARLRRQYGKDISQANKHDLFDAVSAIEIGEETIEVADGYGEQFVFYTTAQERYSITFNMKHFELKNQYYLISKDEALWNLTQKMEEVKE